MPGGESDESVLARTIGQKVRDRRLKSGMSMRALAREAGISQPFLSNVEHGKSTPSMVTIYRLARALGTVPGDLIPDDPARARSVHVVRSGQGKPIPVSTAPDAAVGHALLLDADTNLEVTEYRVSKGSDVSAWFSSPGTAAVYVVSGSLDVEVAGEGTWRLNPGDFIRHDGGTPHRWHFADSDTVHALLLLEHDDV